MIKLLIVDDSALMRRQLLSLFEAKGEFAILLVVRDELDGAISHSTWLFINASQVSGYVEPEARQPEPIDWRRWKPDQKLYGTNDDLY